MGFAESAVGQCAAGWKEPAEQTDDERGDPYDAREDAMDRLVLQADACRESDDAKADVRDVLAGIEAEEVDVVEDAYARRSPTGFVRWGFFVVSAVRPD